MSQASEVDTYIKAIIQYYTSADRPYGREGFPGIDVPGLSITQVLTPESRTQVVGPPGSGKTTFLDWVALSAAQSCQAIPIFVSLRHYSSNLTDLLYVSVERFSSDIDPKHILGEKSKEPGLAFLFDGMDEVPPPFRPMVENDISELGHSLPSAPMVITSRVQLTGAMWKVWSTVVIPELTDDQIDSYLSDLPRDDVLRHGLLENPQLKVLLRRPYFLFTIRNAWLHGEDFRSYLMLEIPRYVAWRGHTKSSLPTSLAPKVVDDLLSDIALDLAVRGVDSLNVDRLMELAAQHTVPSTPASVLADAVQATDVLRRDGEWLSFSHLSLLEVYAARALAAKLGESSVFEPLLIAVLAGPFRIEVANNFLSLISDKEISHLPTWLSRYVHTKLIGMAREALADRVIVSPDAKMVRYREFARVAANVTRFSERQERARKDILVIAVHGFNTRGDWKNELGFLLTRATDGERFLYRAWDYGKFTFGLFNPSARRQQVKRFQSFFNNLVGSFAEVPEIAIVAHSFGTYIFAHAVRRFPEIVVDRVLLLGAALPQGFDWGQSITRCGTVLNLIGSADGVLALAQFVPGLGTAGKDGFLRSDEHLIQFSEVYSEHGDLFGVEYMRRTWLPFLRDGSTPCR